MILRDGRGKNDLNRVENKLYLFQKRKGKKFIKPLREKNDGHRNQIRVSRVDYARGRY